MTSPVNCEDVEFDILALLFYILIFQWSMWDWSWHTVFNLTQMYR